MSNLEKAKEVIAEFILYADCGIFNIRNLDDEPMTTIFDNGEIQIDICPHWSYFEVFGLSSNEFNELEKYYNELTDKL